MSEIKKSRPRRTGLETHLFDQNFAVILGGSGDFQEIKYQQNLTRQQLNLVSNRRLHAEEGRVGTVTAHQLGVISLL